MKHIESITFTGNKHSENFPFSLPLFRNEFSISFGNPIVIVAGDNGSGKSTLLEAIAFKLRLPTIGKHTHLTDSSFAIERSLSDYFHIRWQNKTPHGMFFRAEDYIGFVRSINTLKEELDQELKEMRNYIQGEGLERAKALFDKQKNELEHRYRGNLAEKSHGEGFLEIFSSRIHGNGVYILDEPEASLSPMKQLALVSLLKTHAEQGDAQFILATHSPIIMAIPGSSIYYINEGAIENISWQDTEHYQVYHHFLQNPELFLRHL